MTAEQTNQESIECTCRVGTVVTDGRVDGDEVIIHGPCHSPGLEVWADLIQAGHTLCWFWETYHSCACGARAESLNTHPHVPGCPTAKALARKGEDMKLETTDKPTIANDPFESWWYYQGLGLFDGKLTKNELRGAFAAGRLGEFEGEATELKKERDTLLARNEALERALRDFAEHGLRADLHPTSIDGLPGGRPWEEYLQRIDSTVRARARKALINGEGK